MPCRTYMQILSAQTTWPKYCSFHLSSSARRRHAGFNFSNIELLVLCRSFFIYCSVFCHSNSYQKCWIRFVFNLLVIPGSFWHSESLWQLLPYVDTTTLNYLCLTSHRGSHELLQWLYYVSSCIPAGLVYYIYFLCIWLLHLLAYLSDLCCLCLELPLEIFLQTASL